MTVSADGTLVTYSNVGGGTNDELVTCEDQPMRSGRHYWEIMFPALSTTGLCAGVVRAGLSERSKNYARGSEKRAWLMSISDGTLWGNGASWTYGDRYPPTYERELERNGLP